MDRDMDMDMDMDMGMGTAMDILMKKKLRKAIGLKIFSEEANPFNNNY
jgi:hypothetical protein